MTDRARYAVFPYQPPPKSPDAAPTISAYWFEANWRGRGPTAFALRVEGVLLATPILFVSVEEDDELTAEDLARSPSHRALLGGEFSLDRENAEELHRQLGAWLARTAPAATEEPSR